jgi:hypothetical protein
MPGRRRSAESWFPCRRFVCEIDLSECHSVDIVLIFIERGPPFTLNCTFKINKIWKWVRCAPRPSPVCSAVAGERRRRQSSRVRVLPVGHDRQPLGRQRPLELERGLDVGLEPGVAFFVRQDHQHGLGPDRP